MKKIIAIIGVFTIALAGAWATEHNPANEAKAITVTGEVVDMACYIDHGATGAKHAECAQTCIESGLPVGIKSNDGKTYLLIGEHEPLNKKLATYAAQTITIKGQLATRDGINLIKNAEIVSGSHSAVPVYTCPMHPEVVSDKLGNCPKCKMTLVPKKDEPKPKHTHDH